MICKKCGTKMEMERDRVYASIPPQYGFKCPKCGAFEYSTTPEYDDVVGDAIADDSVFNTKFKKGDQVCAKQPKELAGRTGFVVDIDTYRKMYEVQFGSELFKIREDYLELVNPETDEFVSPIERAEKQPEPSDDVLTEEKVYDYYQERSTTAGERADQLAWMFIVMMTGGLISGHAFQAFSICSSLAAVYMLLSVAQAVWQTFTSWLFKNRLKKMDVAPDDYPSWVGGGAWLFFWAKMITIASAVIYFVKAIFF